MSEIAEAPRPTRDAVSSHGATEVLPPPESNPRGPADPRPADGAARPVATVLPGYRMLRKIGQGAMGEVHLAEREGASGVGLRCVVKLLRPNAARDATVQRSFVDEARITASLRHPNIVTVHDVVEQGGRLAIAMEWVDGASAADLVARLPSRRTMPLAAVLFLIRETLQGLHHAHTAADTEGRPLRLVHRDISPANILVSRQGAVKLTDFGVALAAFNRVHEAPGTIAGKLHYFAPEVLDGLPASAQSDVFSLGVVFYELLSGRPLFDRGLDWREVFQLIRVFDARALVEDDLTLPDGLDEIVVRALANDPADRYGSALEFLEDINDYAYETGVRLLDAHFAGYVERLLAGPGASPS